MNDIEFIRIVENRFKNCLDILNIKKNEYARNNDRLSNFKEAAELLHCRPEQALIGMMVKHVVSIIDMVNDDKLPDQTVISEKTSDAINYLVLLEALFRERKGE